MNNERDLATEVGKGAAASSIVANPAFQDAMSQLKTAITDEWRNCPIRDQEGQQLLLQLAKVADKFEGLLVGAIDSGKLAKIKLDDLRSDSPAKRLFRRVI